jgi:probable rRNA maturation factor
MSNPGPGSAIGPTPRRPGPPEGRPTVFAADEQSDVVVDLDRLVQLAQDVLADRKIKGDCELAITFVDATAMTELNKQFMDEDHATDVLAFPIDDELVESGRSPDSGTTGPDRPEPEPGDVPILLGDVMVCPSVAATNAAGLGRTTDEELALLVVHGILHVLGMDHAEPDEERAMFALQEDLLERLYRTAR